MVVGTWPAYSTTSSAPYRTILAADRSDRCSSAPIRNAGATTVCSACSTRSIVEKSSSASSRCRFSRRAAYQVQRRKVALAAPASAGKFNPMVVRYPAAPTGTDRGTLPP